MQENRKFKELTLEELKAKQKKDKAFVRILSIIILITAFGLIYFAIKSDKYNLLTLCGSFSLARFICSYTLKQIDTEIKSRNLK